MSIEIMLRQVLMDYDPLYHGVERDVARFCKVHRHTIGKLVRGQMKNPSLGVLDSVCSWLIEIDVPYDTLPGALLAFRPPRTCGGLLGAPAV